MAAAWPLDLERSPELIIVDLESKDGDEKAASEGTVDEEANGSEFAERPSRRTQPPTSASSAGSRCPLQGKEH